MDIQLCAGVCAHNIYPPPGYAAAHTTLTSGSCGDNATYEFWKDANNVITLEISGKGAISEIPGSYAPKHIIVNEGITSIPERAFSKFTSIYDAVLDIDIAGSVKTIGSHALWGCYVSQITLHEGLETIEDYALYPGRNDYPTVVIPASVKSIGENAFSRNSRTNLHGEYTPNIWVYAGSVGEQWCIDNKVNSYRVLSDNLSSYDKAFLTFSQAVDATRDLVPTRYREEVISVVGDLHLTAKQLGSLTSYVNTEKSALRSAMLDGSLSISEITGFVSRFITQMDAINVGVDCEITWYGRYPGVHLTITANGTVQEYKIYRNDGNSWSFSYLYEPNDEYYYYETDDGIIVTGLKDYSTKSKITSLTIPATIDGKAVYGVKGGYYDYAWNLESLTLSEGIKWIGASTFSNSKTLKTLNLPSSLETIRDGAFNNCTALEDVSIGSNLVYMGNAFVGTSVGVDTTIAFGAKLQHLGRGFENMTIASSNSNYTMDGGVVYETSSNTLVYYPSTKTTSKYTVMDGTVTILSCGNSYTKTIVLPDSVRVIQPSAFAGDTALTSVTLNEGLVYIGARAFEGCSALKSIDFPSTLTKLNGYAMEGCSSITELTISSPLERLSYPGYMEKLTSITFTSNISYYDNTWSGYSDLSTITVYDQTYPERDEGNHSWWANRMGFTYVHVTDVVAETPVASFTAHEITVTLGDVFTLDAEVTGSTKDLSVGGGRGLEWLWRLSDGPTKNMFMALTPGTHKVAINIKEYNGEYYEYTPLDTCTVTVKDTSEKLTLPSGIKKVDSYAFMNTNARIVAIPEGVTAIADHAFVNCSNLSVVYLPSTITSIDKTAFSGCGTFALVFPTYDMYDEMYDAFDLNNCSAVNTFID